MSGSSENAFGISIIITCGSERPEATRKSTTLSSDAESEPLGRLMGLKSPIASPSTELLSSASRALIQLLLPERVLISPLWQIRRNGWARSQVGKVLVEKREWTIASREAVRGSPRSG